MRKWDLVSRHAVKSIEDFKNVVTTWAQSLKGPVVVLLEGPMGTGKTQWVRMAVEELGGKWVSSPSFAVIQRYNTPKGKVDHVDLYRIKDQRDLESTGFWDLFENPEVIAMIEWPERAPESAWPLQYPLIKISISFVDGQPHYRSIEIRRSH